jgi:hypothetical protein
MLCPEESKGERHAKGETVSETYIVLVAETEGGKLKTALVHEDEQKVRRLCPVPGHHQWTEDSSTDREGLINKRRWEPLERKLS